MALQEAITAGSPREASPGSEREARPLRSVNEVAAPLRRWRRPVLGLPLAMLVRGLGLTPRELGAPIREGAPRAEVARRDAIFRRVLILADVLAAAISVVLCVTVLGNDVLEPWALLALPLVVVAGKAVGIYDRDELLINKTTIDQAPQLFQLATLYALMFVLLQHRFVEGVLGTSQLLALWVTMLVLALLARGAARAFAYRVTTVERVLFVGTESSCDRLRVKLASTGGRAVVVGRMTLGNGEAHDERELVEAAAATLHRLVEELGIHRVVVEPSEPLPRATLDFVREAKGTGARVSLLPRILEVVGASIEVDDLHGLTLLGVRRFGLSRSSALLKRGFDVLGAGLGLLAVAPLLAVAAVAIRLDSRGPVIYRQPRVGQGGAPFTIWKLRTMVEGADALKPSLRALNEADGLFKIASDPRVTRVGRLLRRYSLDELPQLFNVLSGAMSLVGPRPLVADDDAHITGLDRNRLHLTPGMTGHWQILGSARVPLGEMIKLDYLYVASWSLWSDVKILARTLPYVVARRGM